MPFEQYNDFNNFYIENNSSWRDSFFAASTSPQFTLDADNLETITRVDRELQAQVLNNEIPPELEQNQLTNMFLMNFNPCE